MNFAGLDMQRAMRGRLATALRRGRLALIDIGSSAITCVILRIDPERLAAPAEGSLARLGAIEVAGAATVQARGVRRGEIVDMDAAARTLRQAILSAEDAAGPQTGRVDHALVAFSGGRPESFSTVGEVDTETGQVTARDISNALGAAPEPPIGEGRQFLHAQPVSIALDHQGGLTDPRGMTGRRLSVALHLLAVDSRPVGGIGECVRQCDLDLCGIVSAPYAAGLAALVEDELRLGAVCIDMGAGGTGIALFLRDHLICAERIRFGGEHVTSDIAAGLMMRTALAERIKRLEGGVVPTAADDRDMIDAPRLGEEGEPAQRQISRGMLIGVIRPRMEEIFRHVHARLVELGVGAMPGCSVVLTGGACQMPGLDEMATRILGRRPRIGRPIRIAGLDQEMAGPDRATVVGLALHAVQPHDEIWDFAAPQPRSARGRAGEMIRWLRASF